MAVQAWKRRLACLWSVEMLFPDLGETSFWPDRVGLPHSFSSEGYLWTFTLADPEDRQDPRRALLVWRKFQNGYLRRRGLVCVRALERGFKSGQYHFHAVTPQEWDLEDVRAWTSRCGFGRINVKRVPRDRIFYLAKYVGKGSPRWRIAPGVRTWASCGFQGVKVNGIRFHEKTLTVMPDLLEYPYRRRCTWWFDGQKVAEQIRSAGDIPGAEYADKNMNITKENGAHLVGLLAAGSILAVGEYRTCSARELRFKDEDTGKEKVRKLVEHGVEIGDSQVTVTEWLPDEADLKSVKPSVLKGDPCVVEIDGFSKKYGITAKSIRSLASFNGKLA